MPLTSSEFSVFTWNAIAVNLALAFWIVATIMAAGYFIRLNTIRESKDKFDFINRYEIGWLWKVVLVAVAGGCVFGNSALLDFSMLWILVRVFVTLTLGAVVALVSQHLLKFYYPFYMESRLKKLRYQPRISPAGKTMRLLTEQEEDAYMDEGMLAEENIFSVDYDVWKDDTTGFVKIERYAGHLHALKCAECGCQTMKLASEQVVKPPRNYEDGLLEKHFLCGYCQHTMSKTVRLRYTSKLDSIAQGN